MVVSTLPPDSEKSPQAAALAALRDLPSPDPVPALSMLAEGRLVIIGEAEVATGWAARLAGQREVTVLATGAVPATFEPEDVGDFVLELATDITMAGHLGAYSLGWKSAVGSRQATFDVVLDLSAHALLNRVELPDGYAAPGRDPLDQALAVIDLLGFAGEFEKPRYVAVNERICAHSRSRKAGCSNCIEVCATAAITSAGDAIKLDPYLCQGCGTCTTVCPSGALSYQYPRVADAGMAIKAQLRAYSEAGGESPCLLFHSAEAGRKALSGMKLPPNVVPVEIWSADAVGLDLQLGALALGASQVAVLGAGSHDLAPLQRQARVGQAILGGLGYSGDYLRIVDGDRASWLNEIAAWPANDAIPVAEFRLLADKRTTLEFAIDHLIKHAPGAPESIELPAGAPFGTVAVSDACTLCMSCASACPAGALKAAADSPRLSFLERNCVQCGLCASTCPEQAITLTPRLLVKDRRAERELKAGEIFCCTACGKQMGAAPTILGMISKLSGHSMFATPEARARLSMCGDCRVIDLMQSEKTTKAWEMTE